MGVFEIVLLTIAILVLIEGIILFSKPKILLQIARKKNLIKKIAILEIISSIIILFLLFSYFLFFK